MKKLIVAILVLGAVIGTKAALSPVAVYANHVCPPGTPRAGRAISHTGERAELWCTGRISDDEARVALSDAPADCTNKNPTANNCRIIGYVVTFIRVLSALVGVVVVGSIVYGGIQYTMSKDNPQATAAARERIRDAIIALVGYIFTFAFLQWLVPGGVV